MAISFRSGITRKILSYFFIHDKEKVYVNELARQLDEFPANTHQKLLVLKEEGILEDEIQGKQRYFFLNKEFRFLKEYKEIVKKSFGIEVILKEKLTKIKGIKEAYIFGSYAQNKLTPTSDIDLLVVGKYDFNLLHDELRQVRRLFNIDINPVEYSLEEYSRKLKNKEHFLTEVFKTKVIKII